MFADLDADSAFTLSGDNDLIVPLAAPLSFDISGTHTIDLSILSSRLISILLPSVQSTISMDFAAIDGTPIRITPAPATGLGTSVGYSFPLAGRTQDNAIGGLPSLNRFGDFTARAEFTPEDFTPAMTDFRIGDVSIAYDGSGLTAATAVLEAMRIDPGVGTAQVVNNPVPEPSSLVSLLLGAGCLGMVVARRRSGSDKRGRPLLPSPSHRPKQGETERRHNTQHTRRA